MVQLETQLGGHHRRLKVLWQGRMALALNMGSQERDFLLQRPTIHPLLTPGGLPVTEHSAHNRVHHRGVWIGHARINGVNCFHDGAEYGRIRVVAWQSRQLPDGLALSFHLSWEGADGQPVATEERILRFFPALPFGDTLAHRLEVDSTLTSVDGPLELGQDSHAFCGVRLSDLIDEEDGGTIINSEGDVGETGAMGKLARWVDASGTIGSQTGGITLMVHPSTGPQPFFVRSYGTLLANLTLHQSLTVPTGGSLVQRFALLVHDGSGTPKAIEAAYAAFAKSDGRI